MSGNFSWITLFFFTSYFAFLYLLVSHIKSVHLDLYESFGGKRIWFSALDQMKFFKFIFAFNYLKVGDRKLTALAISTKMILLCAVYFLFTQPIYFHDKL